MNLISTLAALLGAFLFISAIDSRTINTGNTPSVRMLKRAPRSTDRYLKSLEAEQSIVIDELACTGDLEIAARLARCQFDRQHRPQGWPWRCKSAGGCLFCYRAKVLSNWRGFRLWLAGLSDETSIAIIPLHGEPLAAVRKLRKGLRDVRDRSARVNLKWRDVAMGGLISGDQATILIRHLGIRREMLWRRLEQRWPNAHVLMVDATIPSLTIKPELALTLARKRRGLEPVRVILPPQVSLPEDESENEDGPMPFLF